jgi:hypothetical protein
MSGGGTYIRFSVGSRGTSGHNLSYISRESAVFGERERGEFYHQNIPEYAFFGKNYEEIRESLIGYAAREESLEKEGRTHYRVIISFEEQTKVKDALEMVREWLGEALPSARCTGFFHQNTEHLHTHIWIQSRGIDGKKLHFSARDYRTLDEKWNRIYCREMGRDEKQHLDKKRDYDNRSKNSYYREKPRDAFFERGEQETKCGEREITEASRSLQNLHGEAINLRHGYERLSGEVKRVYEDRGSERGYEKEKNYERER